MWILFAVFVALTVLLAWLSQTRQALITERFADMVAVQQLIGSVDLATLPEPQVMFRRARELLDRYDRPEFWNHAAQIMDKDPAELARLHLLASAQQQQQKPAAQQ
jgi:hypothetical protein